MTTWNILYRGSLSSCNYACSYCPFAKTANTPAELRADELELTRFVAWVRSQTQRIGLLFTPWGEALVHSSYRQALVALSQFPQVYRVSIQTNLSAPIDDLTGANRDALALWATFHPSQTTLPRFVARCRDLDRAGIRYSVGVVGLREHFPAIEELRGQLRPDVYLWINAYKQVPAYYLPGEIDRLLAIDPYFHLNLNHYASEGQPCRAGETTFSVDGQGNIRRCHFLPAVLGNIYSPDFATCLRPRLCSAATCGCHIGYVHQPALRLDDLFGVGLLERIPRQWPGVMPRFARQGVGSDY